MIEITRLEVRGFLVAQKFAKRSNKFFPNSLFDIYISAFLRLIKSSFKS